jgi:ribosomal-protein-alanine N-acetyltransferase
VLPDVVDCATFRLRPWVKSDKVSLVECANNRNIWRNLWDAFPHPYTEQDAERWLASVTELGDAEGTYAIEIAGRAVGTIALEMRSDIERLAAEIGYWLGEPYWGRGIVSEAVG